LAIREDDLVLAEGNFGGEIGELCPVLFGQAIREAVMEGDR
jgi:hypothetical protein